MATRSGQILAHVMACCLTAARHYLNQCWLFVSDVFLYSPESNSRAMFPISILDGSLKTPTEGYSHNSQGPMSFKKYVYIPFMWSWLFFNLPLIKLQCASMYVSGIHVTERQRIRLRINCQCHLSMEERKTWDHIHCVAIEGLTTKIDKATIQRFMQFQSIHSLSGWASSRKISWSLEAVRFYI